MFNLYPGILSSLSTVPPVSPSPLPLILGTATPEAATIGATINVILSPTPPVECLSHTGLSILLKSIISPLLIIISVK